MRSKLLRNLAGVVIAIAVAVGVLWLQWRSDMARAKEGREIVEGFRAPASSVGFERVIQAWHPGCRVAWSGRTESGCMDQVRVEGAVTEPSDHEPRQRYEFVVDVNTHQIAPGNEPGRRAIAALAPSGSASASAPGSAPR